MVSFSVTLVSKKERRAECYRRCGNLCMTMPIISDRHQRNASRIAKFVMAVRPELSDSLSSRHKTYGKGIHKTFNFLAHRPLYKLGEVPGDMSVKKRVTVDVSYVVFWQ